MGSHIRRVNSKFARLEFHGRTEATQAKAAHANSPKIKQKEKIYEAEYVGSGTFRIVKPKRKDAKRRQSALKVRRGGARK